MWEQHEPGFGQLTKLLPDTVFSFSSNFSLLLSTTRELLPEARAQHACVVVCARARCACV
jgi:hypothetical protein